MSTRILFITLLLLSVCLWTRGFAGRHPSRPVPCCKQVTTDNISSYITGNKYANLPARKGCKEAIILRDEENKMVCADPKAEWVKKLITKMQPGKP
ncbi:hypothetical protein PAMP_010928 [Pampus punctatissimus]